MISARAMLAPTSRKPTRAAVAGDRHAGRNVASLVPESKDRVASILAMSEHFGNQAVQRFLRPGVIQSKLTISQPGDAYEQEADRVAEQLMRMPEPQTQPSAAHFGQTQPLGIPRMCTECEEEVHRQPIGEGDVEESTKGDLEDEVVEKDTEPDETGMPKRETGADQLS